MCYKVLMTCEGLTYQVVIVVGVLASVPPRCQPVPTIRVNGEKHLEAAPMAPHVLGYVPRFRLREWFWPSVDITALATTGSNLYNNQQLISLMTSITIDLSSEQVILGNFLSHDLISGIPTIPVEVPVPIRVNSKAIVHVVGSSIIIT